MKAVRFLIALVFVVALFGAAMPAAAQAGLPPLCSGVQLQNTTTTDATNLSLNFYSITNTTGNPDYSYTDAAGLTAGGSKSYYIPSLPTTIPDGTYSVIVNSSQPLNSLVNEVKCPGTTGAYVVASHSGVQATQVGTTVYLGYVLSHAFGTQNWSSVVAIQNAGTAVATDVKIDLYAAGSSTPTATYNIPAGGLQPGATWYLDLSGATYGITAGFAGSAKITSSQPLAAVTNYAPAAGDRLLSYNGVTTFSTKLFATQITKAAFSQQFTSGIVLYNPNTTDTPVSVKFFKSGETAATCTIGFTMAANASWVKYIGAIDGSTGDNRCAEAGANNDYALPNNFNGYAVIETTGGNSITGIFNFNSQIGQAGAANLVRFEDAATTLYFPQILRDAFGGYQSGWQIVNTSASALTITLTYTKDSGTVYSHTLSVPANSAYTVYVGASTVGGNDYETNLGHSWNGGLKIEVTSGGGTIVGQANIVASGSNDTLSVYNAFTQ